MRRQPYPCRRTAGDFRSHAPAKAATIRDGAQRQALSQRRSDRSLTNRPGVDKLASPATKKALSKIDCEKPDLRPEHKNAPSIDQPANGPITGTVFAPSVPRVGRLRR